jgi:hypothetical protein
VSDGGLEVWIDTSDQHVRRYSVAFDGGFTPLDNVALGAVFPTGLVVDDRSGRLMLALQTQGIWVREPDAGLFQILSVGDGGFPAGVFSVGGVALYPLHDGGTLLLTTVPGTGELVVHDLASIAAPKLLGSVRIGAADGGLARVSLPSWVDVSQFAVGGFDAGVLVIHDGSFNNYKLVGWEALAAAFVPPLPIELRSLFGAVDAGLDAGLADAGSDAGVLDAGSADGGATDGGATDGGVTDGGVRDGGSSGGGGGPPITGGSGGGDPGQTGCGCSSPAGALGPALTLFAWFLRRQRRAG